MTRQTRRITIWTLVTGLGTIVGLLVNLPRLISEHGNKLPTWATSPDTIWVVGILVIYTCILVYVIRRDRKLQAAHGIKPLADLIKFSQRAAELTTKHKRRFGNDPTKYDERAVKALLRLARKELPTLIQRELGTLEREKYWKTLEPTMEHEASQAVLATILAMQEYAVGLCKRKVGEAGRLVTDTIRFRFESEVGQSPSQQL
jgi:hypothetical protein